MICVLRYLHNRRRTTSSSNSSDQLSRRKETAPKQPRKTQNTSIDDSFRLLNCYYSMATTSTDLSERVKKLADLNDAQVQLLANEGIQGEDDLKVLEFVDLPATIPVVKRRKLNYISRFLGAGHVLNETMDIHFIQTTVIQATMPRQGTGTNSKARPAKARASLGKRGRKKGVTCPPLRLTVADWYAACETYTNLKVKMGQSEFLRSPLSGIVLTGTRSEQGSFSKKLRIFQSGSLKNPNPDAKRNRKRDYVVIEDKLVQYLKGLRTKGKETYHELGVPVGGTRGNTRTRRNTRTSWLSLKEKCLQWARDLELHDFKCSNGWLQNTFKIHGIERSHLHGEADLEAEAEADRDADTDTDDISDEEVAAAIAL